jgi:transcriptional regulator with XRE-family HTH domain
MLTKSQLSKLRRANVGAAGNRLAFAMQMLNLTQLAVAAGTGFRQTYISAVCNGVNQTITVQNASRFAQYFGCQIEDLFPARHAVAS